MEDMMDLSYRGNPNILLDQMAIVKNEYLQLLRSREPEWEQEEADEEWGVEVVR